MDGQTEFVETVGARIRQFFRELLGSRIAEHLEVELLHLRQDFEQRLQEKDLLVATLREEKQLLMLKVTAYEFAVMPRTSRAGAEAIAYQQPAKPKPSFEFLDVGLPKSRWQIVQETHDEQMRQELAADAAVASAKSANSVKPAATAA